MTMTLPAGLREDVRTLWDHHDMGHQLRPVDIGIGSHDLGGAVRTTDLYHCAYFPRLVFTGANVPTTVERFPRGEATHYQEHAVAHGVPDEAILVEPRATNTSENIQCARALLAEHGHEPKSLILITRPHHPVRPHSQRGRLFPSRAVFRRAQRS